jgi:hypothetical protein
MISPVATISPAGHVPLLDVLAMNLLGMTNDAMPDRRRILQTPAVANALPTRVGLPAWIKTGGHSSRVYSVQLVDGQVMWQNNAICLPQQFALSGI